MEYVQTVLVQIDASVMDEAARPGGLLDELDAHRGHLRQQAGFVDMQVTRSINAEGNVLLVIETRWSDDSSLVAYETHEPNVATIVGKHDDIIVRDSLQVLDMEAVRAEPARPEPAAQAGERLALPLLIPMGVLAFTLLVVYGLSRVYLELENDVATGLAAAIAVGVLGVAWFIASRPGIPAWQIASIGVVAAAVLTGGALFAVIDEDEGEATVEPQPTASPSPTGSPQPGGGLAVEMGDNFFTYEGQQEPTIPVPAGQESTINLTNAGIAVHNMRIAGVDNSYNTDDDFVSDPELISGGQTGTLTFKIDTAGTYDFHCDFHPDLMKGKVQIQ